MICARYRISPFDVLRFSMCAMSSSKQAVPWDEFLWGTQGEALANIAPLPTYVVRRKLLHLQWLSMVEHYGVLGYLTLKRGAGGLGDFRASARTPAMIHTTNLLVGVLPS